MIIKAPPVILNDQYIKDLGHLLREARERCGESIPEMADKLLFSKDQIAGLENYTLNKFYGERHFVQALIKYAEFLNLPVERDQLTLHGDLTVGAIETDNVKSQPATPRSVTSEVQETSDASFADLSALTRSKLHADAAGLPLDLPPSSPHQAKSNNAFVFGMATTGIIGIVLLMQWGMLSTSATDQPVTAAATAAPFVSTASTAIANTATTMASAAEPSVAAGADKPQQERASGKPLPPSIESPSLNNAHVVVETNGTCWIQFNHADGKSSQKVYPPNSKLQFARGELSGIIIGNLNAATLLVNNQNITLAQYQKPDSNVARILGQDGAKLLGK